MTQPLRLVVFDNNIETAKQFAASLSTDGVVVYCIADSDEACQLISLLQHDVLLIDIDKLIRTPIYPLQAFRQAKPDLKIVGISCGQRKDTELLMELLGLDAYIPEPVTPEALMDSLPEIADRYLVAPLESTPGSDHNAHYRQKEQPAPISFTV